MTFCSHLFRWLAMAAASVCILAPALANEIEIELEKHIRGHFNFKNQFKLVESGVNGYHGLMFDNDWRQVNFYKDDLSVFGASAWWNATPQKNKSAPVSDTKALDAIRYDVISKIKPEYLLGPYGEGSRMVVVYSAPDCPFCREFDQSMLSIAKAHDIRFFVVPVLLRGDSEAFRAGIWCNDQPMKVWEAAIRQRRMANSPQCDRSKVVNRVAGMFFSKVSGNRATPLSTPAFVFENGRMVTGFSPDKVNAVFAKQ